MRHFNTAGPCKPELHYMLPSAARLPEARRLIEQQGYFVLHAPRQSGKTTVLQELAQELTASGRYVAVLVSVETGSAFNAKPDMAEQTILANWQASVAARLPAELQPAANIWRSDAAAGARLRLTLQAWARTAPHPLVVFIDEIDSLQDELLAATLRQLRDGYADRPAGFPWSLALIGLRDVRDYKIASGGSERLNTASPFNIKMRSLTLGNFTAEEVAALYSQHTTETGQLFTAEAVARAFQLTQGQPYLVNAVAKVAVEEISPDTARSIEAAHIEEAKDILIQRQETHLDSLAARLHEPRVRAVIEPLLAGQGIQHELPEEDIRFVVELGLARYDQFGRLAIANPIYGEVIPRVLTTTTRAFLPRIQPIWLNDEGILLVDKLLEAFLLFWRQHGAALLNTVSYPEIAPHLVLMAFLDRVANGGGSVTREYAVGEDYLDLCLRYGAERVALELKVWRTGAANPLKPGLEQLEKYLEGMSLATGWLVIFDQRKKPKRVKKEPHTALETTPGGKPVTVIYT